MFLKCIENSVVLNRPIKIQYHQIIEHFAMDNNGMMKIESDATSEFQKEVRQTMI
jgi:hypothetical protein